MDRIDAGAAGPLHPQPADDPLWFKDAVIYELHVKAFFDSNDDGVGDFAGLTQKLDYIRDLGVDTLWLLPFYPSPLKDDGYDVADYHGVLPAYGTRADFRHFVREAHRRGLRVITELVINHTSDQHPWFQAARRAPKGSSKRDYYVWSDDPKRYAGTRIIFTDTETSNWTWDPVAGAYYWHRFFSHQPDLNFENPRVLRAVLRTMRFWLDIGVDGFRLDAVPYLREREGTTNENLAETHATIREIRRVIDEHYRGRILLAEANQWPEDVREYFGDGDECHMAYHFPLMPRLFMALAQEDRYPVTDIMRQTPDIPENCQWAIFLRNHDELTLEMVTDRERDYMWQFFANDPRMRLNVGIRRRLAPLLENSRDRIELMSFLLFTLPGSPIVYYGDELGMGDNVYLGDRNGVRTPMQWTSDRNAGFSRADPQQLYLPPIMDPVYGYPAINVEAQARNPHSLLNFTRRLIAMRRSLRAFGRGSLVFLEPGNRKVLAYLREYVDDDGNEQRVLCVANLARTPQAVELDLARHEGRVPMEISGRAAFPPVGRLPYLLTLPGHGFYAFELSAQAPPPEWHEDRMPQPDLPILVLTHGWETFVGGDGGSPVRSVIARRNRERLLDEAMLPFLRTRRWFAAKSATPTRVSLDEVREWRANGGSWLLSVLRVEFADGSPQYYFLPLATAWEDEADYPVDRVGGAALARVREQARMGLLYDAFADALFCRAFADALERADTLPLAAGKLVFSRGAGWAELRPAPDDEVRPAAADQTNTGVFMGPRLYLKAYRLLQPGLNPEIEIGRFLAARGFPGTPQLAGAVEYEAADGRRCALAIAQQRVDNQGTAWDYALEHFARMFSSDAWPGSVEPMDEYPGLNRIFMLQMSALGKAVADLHAALADAGSDPAFAPVPLAAAEAETMRERVLLELERSFAQLEGARDRLDRQTADDIALLLAQREVLRQQLMALPLDASAMRCIRIHGDLHLGQVLRAQEAFIIVDFEGEPARPVDARRGKQLALRDVACMIRSIDYAIRTAAQRVLHTQPERAGELATMASAACADSVAAFLSGYSGGDSLPAAAGDFLELFSLERLLYELRYELDNRPDMVGLPLGALIEASGAEKTFPAL